MKFIITGLYSVAIIMSIQYNDNFLSLYDQKGLEFNMTS